MVEHLREGKAPSSTGEGISSKRFILPSLVLARGVTQPPLIITGLLLIEVGNTFGVPVGVSGQIRTASFIISIIFALLMGALSVKFRSKSLLMSGLVIYVASSFGCYFAPDYNVMLIVFSMTGLAFGMVVPMVITLIAEQLPQEKRAGAIGWTNAGASLTSLFGTFFVNYIANLSGWRWTFLGFALPLSVLSLLLVAAKVPYNPDRIHSTMKKESYVEGFREVFSKRSANACLIGTILSIASYHFLFTYGASFWRQRFLVSTDLASYLIMGLGLGFTVGSLICERVVKKIGVKPSTVFSTFIVGVLILFTAIVPSLSLSIVLGWASAIFAGMMITAFSSLTLEQVPRFRGTMMSLSSAALSTGAAVGTGLGGLVLLSFDYTILGLTLGSMGVLAASIFYLFTVDKNTDYIS